MSDTPRLNGKSSQQPVPFAVQRRRSKLACVNCQKRKVRCIAPEQPPTNPCARCTRRRLTCEYVVSTEDDSSPPANQSPETGPSDLPDDPPPDMIWTLPITAPNFFRNLAPPLPYTGPPPLNRHPRYAGQPLPGLGQPPRYSNQDPMHPRYLSPPPAVLFQPSTHPRFGEHTTYHSRPSVPPALMYGYDVQARQDLSTRVRPLSMPPNMAGQHYPSAPNAADYEMSFGDMSMDEYFEWPRTPVPVGADTPRQTPASIVVLNGFQDLGDHLDEPLQAFIDPEQLLMDDSLLVIPKSDIIRDIGVRNRREKFGVPRSHIQRVVQGQQSFEYLTVHIDDARAVPPRTIVADMPPHLAILEYVPPNFFSEDSDQKMVAAEENSDSSTDSIDWDFQQDPPTQLFPSAANKDDAKDDAISSDSHITGVEDLEEFAKANLTRRDYESDRAWLRGIKSWVEGTLGARDE
ncbi:hypothetical protein C8R44DRAFT_887032 [Mycena epipterygia]|nr:hypothetical protein C8R44DRAFT_887032 [Mycena epipterygia]